MRIRVVGHDGSPVFPFGESGPWASFRDVLLKAGHKIVDGEFGQKVDALIAHNHSPEALKEAYQVPIDFKVLVLWEPWIVEKERYKKETLSQYGSVFAPSIEWAEQTNAISFKWPQDVISDSFSFDGWNKRDNRIVIVQGNKFSARKGERYSLRRRILKGRLAEKIDLYGTDWNSGFQFDWWHWSHRVVNSSLKDISLSSCFGMGHRYKSYQGAIASKFQVMTKYKFSLVIENSSDFVSEKLFDSARAGCISIYVGPNLESYGLSKDCAIQVRANVRNIEEALYKLTSLPDSHLEELAKSQYNAIKISSLDWDNMKVLPGLAESILEHFKLNS